MKKERNLFSRKENEFLDFYRSHPETAKTISFLAMGNKMDTVAMVRAYNRNPNKFNEIVETAEHNSGITSQREVVGYIINENSPKFTKAGAILNSLVIGITSSVFCSTTYKTLFEDILNINAFSFQESLLGSVVLGCLIGKKTYDYTVRMRELSDQYKVEKQKADRVIGAKRIDGSNQLEFLFN